MEIDFENLTIETAEVAVRALSDMLASEGWKIYISIVEAQLANRRDRFELTPLKALDQTLEQEFVKGELSGLRLAAILPGSVLETTKEELEALRAVRAASEGEKE